MEAARVLVGLGIIGGGIAGVYWIAKKQGVDVGAAVSDVTSSIENTISEAVDQVTGGGDDPLSIALPLIKSFEGFSANAYPDPPGSGKFSIGYGHQIQPGEPYNQNSQISESEASDLLRVDAAGSWIDVQNHVAADLSNNALAALISFRYNVGSGAFENSTLLRLVNDGDLEGASAQFPLWIHAGGVVNQDLVTRRAQEQELFNS